MSSDDPYFSSEESKYQGLPKEDYDTIMREHPLPTRWFTRDNNLAARNAAISKKKQKNNASAEKDEEELKDWAKYNHDARRFLEEMKRKKIPYRDWRIHLMNEIKRRWRTDSGERRSGNCPWKEDWHMSILTFSDKLDLDEYFGNSFYYTARRDGAWDYGVGDMNGGSRRKSRGKRRSISRKKSKSQTKRRRSQRK